MKFNGMCPNVVIVSGSSVLRAGVQLFFLVILRRTLKLTATGNKSKDVLLLVKPLFLLLRVYGGDFNPRLLLNQSLILPSGAPLKLLLLHRNSPQSPLHWTQFSATPLHKLNTATRRIAANQEPLHFVFQKSFSPFFFLYIYHV